jgi:hypothetical protein
VISTSNLDRSLAGHDQEQAINATVMAGLRYRF